MAKNPIPSDSEGCVGRVSALIESRRGTAAVEFAFLAPLLVTLALGTIDYGALIYQSMQVQAAAHAGADYALRNGWNSSAIQTAVISATSAPVSANPAPQLTNACIVGGVVATTTNPTCASGATAGSYVLVSAQSTVAPIVAWPSFAMPGTVSARAMVRIK